MANKRTPGPALIAAAILAWALMLWFLSINNPSFVPVARAVFFVLIVPMALAEWIKMKKLIREDRIFHLRWGLSVIALAIWYIMDKV
ncbi:MAG: hypothetical protein ACOY30_04110 [Bacillota bacterium]